MTGKLVDAYGSFTGPFVIADIFPLVGYGVFALLARQITPIRFDTMSDEARQWPIDGSACSGHCGYDRDTVTFSPLPS